MTVRLRRSLPLLRPGNHEVTSDATRVYNCIAHAAGDDARWWWPSRDNPDWFWPTDAPRIVSVAAFKRAFETIGYVETADGVLREGVEKVVVYVDDDGRPRHAARQLPDGRWTSKLGSGHDIVHATPEAVAGGVYGEARVFLRRPRPL